MLNNSPPPTENHVVYEITGKYCRAEQATNDRMSHVLCMLDAKVTNTHSEYITLIAFYCNNACTNGPHCNVIHTLPAVLTFVCPECARVLR